tara:strand:- start:4474 stop:5631 length:1158 start_codon:yes stop_codon:yes gene_type:complete
MLRAVVGHSEDPDESEAVREIVAQCREQLGEHKPSAGILFAAIEMEHQVVLNGLLEAFPGISLVGCTTDGELSSKLSFTEDSLTLLLFSCGDGVEITSGLGRRLSDGIPAAVNEAVSEAKSKTALPAKWCFITPESMTVSSSVLLQALQSNLGESFPIAGGLAADQWSFEKTYQFYNGEVLTDALPMLLFSGDVHVSHGVASGWEPHGKMGVVERAEGNVVWTIDGVSALSFYSHYLGPHVKPSTEYPLAVSVSKHADEYYLRAPLKCDEETGSVTFTGDIPEGATVRLTTPEREKIMEACETSVLQAFESFPQGKVPACALIVSCAARKYLLGTQVREEYEILRQHIGDLPVLGFYSYGEIGPSSLGSPACLHNETFVTVLLGG